MAVHVWRCQDLAGFKVIYKWKGVTVKAFQHRPKGTPKSTIFSAKAQSIRQDLALQLSETRRGIQDREIRAFARVNLPVANRPMRVSPFWDPALSGCQSQFREPYPRTTWV